MKMLFVNLLAFFMASGLYAQVKVTGKITTADGKPIAAVNVLLLDPGDTSLVKGCISNEAGVYELDRIVAGRYFIRYTSVGFRIGQSPVFELTAAEGGRKLATQVMEVDAQQLQEVVVQHEKPLYQSQIYGTTVNVENSVLTKGSSALQVLERSPGVYLDHHHNTIALNGKNGVLVMINGKVLRLPLQQVLNLLNGMSADNIEKIELLTTPPAMYDAEGDAGMINIVLKKSKKEGTIGSFSVTGGHGWGEKAAANLNIEHNTRNIDVYGSYSFSHDRGREYWFASGTQNITLLGGHTYFDFWSEIKPVVDNHSATAGLDVQLNARVKAGASINYNYTRASSDVTNRGDYIMQADSFMQLNAQVKGIANRKNLISSFYVEKKIREGERIEFDVDYIYYSNDNPTQVQSSFTDRYGRDVVVKNELFAARQRGLSNTSINVGVGKVDYVRQVNKKIRLEAGGKWTYTSNAGVSGIQSLIQNEWTDLLGKSNNIDMKENIGAAYTSVTTELSKAATLIVGVRYEYSNTLMDDAEKGTRIAERKINNFFPGIFFTQKLSDKSSLELSYSKRINRPSYIDLASNITYNDPVSVFTGDPLLRPTITNNFKIGYNYDGYSISVLLGRDRHPIARYQIVADPGGSLVYISPQNLSYQNNLVFDVKLPWKVNEWWSMNNGFVGGIRQFKSGFTINQYEKTYFDYSVYGSQTFKLPKKYFLEVSGMYNSITYGGVNKVEGFGMVSAGVKKELKNDGGVFNLSVNDIFGTMHIRSRLGLVTDLPFLLRSKVDYNTEGRMFPVFKLTYSRSFGKSTTKGQRKETKGPVDERDRLRKE
jgi:iron complex outermembrane receptor protein